ncbi:MAG TPA: isoprenylcysteine carboxylmethyltransferase family protein [Micropepsaceae bacterium]|nr:isoprenylcysteine carboxylmethyltransferase family protein [Micropepsaceae bacterium]
MAKILGARIWDVVAASPLIVWYLLGSWGLVTLLATELGHFEPDDLQTWAKIITQLTSLAYVCMIIAVFFIRHLPLMKAQGIIPRVIAILASNAQLAFFLLPRAMISLHTEILSAVLISVGAIASVWILIRLRSAFSILPQARALVTTGPYRRIRHPLYAAEGIASLGIMLQFVQPWSAVITLIGFGCQILRMHYEEQVLGAAFPEYSPYKARTYRLVPGVY